MSEKLGTFAALPPQGYAYMGHLQRLDHKVRCAIIDAIKEGAGTWNVGQVLGHIQADIARLAEPAPFVPQEDICGVMDELSEPGPTKDTVNKMMNRAFENLPRPNPDRR